ncbi:IS21-like element helper ATPase IstB [Pseudoalteromonas piscicida]|uniref:IS21-like element helper ATPase IstB n=1 Tax=Pseudoalteromonas piscicida TaxID=43662 RepID=UPI001EFEE432|nr:IS21-like element helper ATPase IstB [Pseudoalteromonas piscicida]MCG9770906.1 IS21-like element helper ATPase IstB [Pseudoalteromonas piscicida]
MTLKEQIYDILTKLKLYGMRDELDRQCSDDEYENMSFLQRTLNLAKEELTLASNTHIARLLKRSNIRWKHASLADIDYKIQKSLKPAVIKELGELEWLNNNRHLIITGATGLGKTYLASAFANAAIMQSVEAFQCRFSELIVKLSADKSEKGVTTFLNKVKKVPLLIIDDWGIAPLTVTERHALFELIELRDQKGSLIITSQYNVGDWYDAFGDETIADSTLDRIVHSAHKINMKGESFRKLMGIKGGLK